MNCQSFVFLLGFIATIFFASFSFPSFAASNLDEGKRLYKEKKYRASKQYLEKAVQEDPKSWQSHFYLGHTLTALGRYSDARYQYKLCKHSTSHPTVHAYCDKALKQVDTYSSKLNSSNKPVAAATPKAQSEKTEGSSESAPEETEVDDPIKARIAKKKKEVMDKAKAECKAIMERVEQQIKAESENTNQRFRYGDGSVGTGLSKEREAAIRKPAEAKCKKIMETAERKARSYR